jgi:hypothetical protein
MREAGDGLAGNCFRQTSPGTGYQMFDICSSFNPASKLVIPATAERQAGIQIWPCITGFPPSRE